jgi:hypothetical protein
MPKIQKISRMIVYKKPMKKEYRSKPKPLIKPKTKPLKKRFKKIKKI